jgi:hypothetical protein
LITSQVTLATLRFGSGSTDFSRLPITGLPLEVLQQNQMICLYTLYWAYFAGFILSSSIKLLTEFAMFSQQLLKVQPVATVPQHLLNLGLYLISLAILKNLTLQSIDYNGYYRCNKNYTFQLA